MAKKSLILDNGDGRVAFSNTSSVSIDDGAGNNMSASYMTASSLSLSGIGVGQIKILSASNGAFSSAFPDGPVDGGAIAFDGTRWVTSSLLVQDYSGSAYGDLSGSYESGVQVKNISNVNAGTLPVAFGGTGKSLTASQAYILKVSSSAGQTPVISALSASSGSIVTTYGGAWTSIPPGYPDVRFYTSGSTGNTFTWTKPAGARFARVILQGAGGGGGGLGVSGTTNSGGGASGGFTDITIDVRSITTATVIVGVGGTGGTGTVAGQTGGSCSFNGQYATTGGSGGGVNGAAATAGGTGLTKNGYSGGAANGTAPPTAYDMPSGGSRGGGAAGTIALTLNNKNFGYPITSDGVDISTSLIPASGAASPTGTATQTRPGYGAGGAGSGTLNTPGGPGGNGYALIISW